MDQITQVKNQYRKEKWTRLLQERQASGLSVKNWCRQNEIKESAYYYWLKKIRKETYANQLSVAKTENTPAIEFAKIQIEPLKTKTAATITINLQFATIEVQEGTSQSTLETVLLALKSVC